MLVSMSLEYFFVSSVFLFAESGVLLSSAIVGGFRYSLFLSGFVLVSPGFLKLDFAFDSSGSLFFVCFASLVVSSIVGSYLVSMAN